nr:Chain P, Phage Display Derived Antigen [synthetic construct]
YQLRPNAETLRF